MKSRVSVPGFILAVLTCLIFSASAWSAVDTANIKGGEVKIFTGQFSGYENSLNLATSAEEKSFDILAQKDEEKKEKKNKKKKAKKNKKKVTEEMKGKEKESGSDEDGKDKKEEPAEDQGK